MNVIHILFDTLRRDHCGPYHCGRTLAEVTGDGQPDSVVPTPNMDRLAEHGTVFDQCYSGSFPCMPARRDIFTGRYEFLYRGWGPLEDDDASLPLLISRAGRTSQLISDHYHLWEPGAGNYHFHFTGFDFVRGQENDAYITDPNLAINWPCRPERVNPIHARHLRNRAAIGYAEDDCFVAQCMTRAADWLDRNHTHENFYLHLDCFDPHEPFDPPERFVKMFDPRGYDVPESVFAPNYVRHEDYLSPDELRHVQALYAAEVAMVDHWLGRVLDAMDRHGLWDNTMVILTSDHGTFNGSRGRLGKLQTHMHDPIAHIPLIIYSPAAGHGQRRAQLAQLVDLYPTTLRALGVHDLPQNLHGIDLNPAIASATSPTRDFAIYGQYGMSASLTDGRHVLHQPPVAANQPLNWYGARLSQMLPNIDLGPWDGARRSARVRPFKDPKVDMVDEGVWLSDLATDPNELENLADREPATVARLQHALAETLSRVGPAEQLERLGIGAPPNRL